MRRLILRGGECGVSNSNSASVQNNVVLNANGYPDNIDNSYVWKGFGGDASSGKSEPVSIGSDGDYAVEYIKKTLAELNSIDPVYQVYGLYTSDGTPLLSYEDALTLSYDGDYTSWQGFLSHTMFEVEGMSGTAYKVADDGTIENKETGDIVITGKSYCNGLPCSSDFPQ